MKLIPKINDPVFTIICSESEEVALFKILSAAKISFEYIPDSINNDSGFTIDGEDASEEEITSYMTQASLLINEG